MIGESANFWHQWVDPRLSTSTKAMVENQKLRHQGCLFQHSFAFHMSQFSAVLLSTCLSSVQFCFSPSSLLRKDQYVTDVREGRPEKKREEEKGRNSAEVIPTCATYTQDSLLGILSVH